MFDRARRVLECGFVVAAIDFNEQLLTELAGNVGERLVSIVNDDIRNVRQYGMGASVTNLSFALVIPSFRCVLKAKTSVNNVAVWTLSIAIKKSEHD